MENKMEEISSQRKLEALEENGTFITKSSPGSGERSCIRLRKQGKSGFWNCHFLRL